MTDVDEEELEEEQDPRVRTTSSERILKLPNCRCYYKISLVGGGDVQMLSNCKPKKSLRIKTRP